ncbi:class II aldolase/adducin family protein [Rhizohabitans arisaemae]|uniref:class II aldolase/adducin family protein n=1 Tax=Rhizohabitans arisaemae TaxID=2720610 RepID=UPI0024B195A1|nr:class II aldolase/adducin family protein [Rhizohabitans arisaemae]
MSADLIELCRDLADPVHGLVVAGEGNVSGPGPDGSLLVTASGCRLAKADERSFVRIDPAVLVGGLDVPCSDERWLELLLESRADPDGPRPTVEAALHAVIADAVGPAVIAHTHPTRTLALLCSPAGKDLATVRYFPDHIVVLGETACWLPYVDPGQELARETRRALHGHREIHGAWPRLVLAAHHGIFAIGATARDALDITLMAEKAAVIALSGADGLTPEQIRRISSREDEQFRRRLLQKGAS